MLEKIDPDVDLTFAVGNAGALAACIEEASRLERDSQVDEFLLRRARAMRDLSSERLEAHLQVYGLDA